jgi:hypothetical protein
MTSKKEQVSISIIGLGSLRMMRIELEMLTDISNFKSHLMYIA